MYSFPFSCRDFVRVKMYRDLTVDCVEFQPLTIDCVEFQPLTFDYAHIYGSIWKISVVNG